MTTLATTALATGVDMAKASFGAAVCIQGQVQALGEYSNDGRGFVHLHSRLVALQAASAHRVIHLVVEPTGGYEQALVAFAHA